MNEATAPEGLEGRLQIQLTNQGGGIGRVVVSINGKEISADARAPKFNPRAARGRISLQVVDNPLLKPGEDNIIEVMAYNAEGYLSNRGSRLIFQAPGQRHTDVSFWAIVVGISTYKGDDLRLRFAAKDAANMAQALRIGAERLFGKQRTHITLLATDQQGALLPTHENLKQAFVAVRKATSADILVVYLAGHGVNYGAQGNQEADYYYLTQEALGGDLTDPKVRSQTAVSSRELTEWIKSISALKQAVILDTCAAAGAIEKLTEKRDVPSSQIRSLERMKDRTGLYLLAGAAANASSYESSRYSQGILTYSLLLGMRGAALREREFVDVSTWLGYAVEQVPQLAKDIGGLQKPEMSHPQGRSFDIGQVVDEDKHRIPLERVHPLFVQSSFVDEAPLSSGGYHADPLKLAAGVNEVLRDMSARGNSVELIFVDASHVPDAYQLTGRYSIKEGRVNVTVGLSKGRIPVLDFKVAEETNAVARLAASIVQEARSQMVTKGIR